MRHPSAASGPPDAGLFALRLARGQPGSEPGTPCHVLREVAFLELRGVAALLDAIILLRPLPFRNEAFGYGVAIAYLDASGERIDTRTELWFQLIDDIRALRLDVYGIAERLRSWKTGG